MDQCDVEYEQIKMELKTEMFDNRCHQDRLGEHLCWLEKKRRDLRFGYSKHDAEESSAKNDVEKELHSNHGQQEKIQEQLQGLEKTLKMVTATADWEDYFQNLGDEVSYSMIVTCG